MGQFKKMIAVLLPFFWLAALVSGPFETLACAQPAECANSSSPGHTQSCHTCCSANDPIRCELRRDGVVRIQVEQPRMGLFFQDQPIPATRFGSAIPPTGEAFLLQQRWQFIWRTADFPRAPSSLA